MSEVSANLSLPYLQPSQAQKHVTHNEALRQLDMIVQLNVVETGATQPPLVPTTGEVYALGQGATNDWAGQDDSLATFDGTAWNFVMPQTGWRAWDHGDDMLKVWNGTAWVAPGASTQNLAGVGVGTTSDAVNRLAVVSEATLLNHAGAGHQLKINKSTGPDTASLLFQTGFSGRAEMGLAGGDDFTVKVSADGSAFSEAIHVDRNSGKVAFPSGMNGTGSAAGPMGGQIVAIIGEEAASLNVGNYQSMGNGSVIVAGAAMPFPGKVLAATMSASDGTAGVNVLSMSINKIEQTSHQVSLTHTGASPVTATADFSSNPLAFSAGDALNMVVNMAGGAEDVVTVFFVQFD
ncbi:DUF2793 domain-containing protein [Tateyamaria sp.]|uniref:DUF2793 domain-containing protein n=1 Tax=Tateyamaria sp. TaxID=1929288 RepID=UPI003282690C